jgi:LPXTG-site transpeptidase (sortase) family protein
VTLKKIVSLIFIGLGIIILLQVLMPLITYRFWENLNSDLVSPTNINYPGVSIKSTNNFPAIYSSSQRGFIPYSKFDISIPKLEMENVKVAVESNDLDKGLVHLPGSALPGERGNVFISGHSSVLFSDNFSKLPNLKTGDIIIIKIGETNLQYRVTGNKVVVPTDLSVIDPPNPDGRFLSLMTCVPPGLNIKRLVVLAELI